MSQKTISNLNPELVTELMTKVRGYSVLAKLSNQSAIPFNGTEQFIFNLDGNAQIVGEGEQKLGSNSSFQSKIIKPIKFVYQSRITDEFMNTTDEKRINYLQALFTASSSLRNSSKVRFRPTLSSVRARVALAASQARELPEFSTGMDAPDAPTAFDLRLLVFG